VRTDCARLTVTVHGRTKRGIDRRTFLVASTAGIAGLRFGSSTFGRPAGGQAGGQASVRRPAKSTILFFLCGGASHLDTWDMKPEAPSEYRGPFLPMATSAPAIRLCEHLPLTARLAHHLAIVNSVGDAGRGTGDHHAGYYYNLTGHAPDQTFRTQGNDRKPYPDDWPFMGSVVGSRLPMHKTMPQTITLPHMPSKLPHTRPGQFAGRLGIEYDPFYLRGDEKEPMRFRTPSLRLAAGMSGGRLDDRRALLEAIDHGRRAFDAEVEVRNYTQYQERAFALLSSGATGAAFDLGAEPAAIRERYGSTLNGTSLLLARRLVEAGVPFVTVFWKENEAIKAKCKSAGGWDTHGNNFNCLKDHLLPEFDRAYSALLEDLAQRGLLDETLVLVSSEMGRKPKIGDPRSGGVGGAGRDHWTACQSVLFAGGGVAGGQVYGASDRLGEYPQEKPAGPEDITKTVYHAMGIDDLRAVSPGGRPFNLLEDGRALTELF